MTPIARLALACTLAAASAGPAVGEPPPPATVWAEEGSAAPGVRARPAEGPSQASAVPAVPEPPAGRPDAAPAPPGPGTTAARLLGALAVVGVLLAATLLLLRAMLRRAGRAPVASRRARRDPGRRSWLGLWRRAGPGIRDRLEILDRGHVGPKESVCIVRAGREQFLIGVTAERISLLGRLGPAEDTDGAPGPPADGDEPLAADFARGLSAAAPPPPAPTDEAFHALLARARERAGRLALAAAPVGARRD